MPLWIPSPFYMSRNGHKPRWIIIHGTAGGSSAQAVAGWFQDSRAQASTHYIIGKDGVVVQCVSEDQAAWGNGAITTGADNWWNHNPNFSTISIEHVKSRTDNDEPLTEAQALASFKLVNEICDRWGIPKRYATADGGITGHFSMDPVNKSGCPGPYPWDHLWSYLKTKEQTVLQLPSQFTELEKDKRWLCKSKSLLTGKQHAIANGILAFYRVDGQTGFNGFSRYGLPTTDEIGLGDGRVVQYFERGAIVYDPKHTLDAPPGYEKSDCYPAHIDKAPGVDLRLKAAQDEITRLKNELAKQLDTAALKTKIDGASKLLASALVDLQ